MDFLNFKIMFTATLLGINTENEHINYNKTFKD